MRFTVAAADLRAALATVVPVVSPSASLAAYTGVLLTVKDQNTSVRGSDGDTTITTVIAGTSDHADGHVVVPPKPLATYLAALAGDETVHVTSETTTSVRVNVDGGDPYAFTALSTSFPATPATGSGNPVNLDTLADGVTVVTRSAGSLSGGKDKVVQLVSDENGTRLHATDRYRLARAHIDHQAPLGTFTGLLRLSTLTLVATLAPDRVHLDTSNSLVTFSNDQTTVTTRLVAEAFPIVDSVLGATPPHRIRLDRDQVRAALGRLKSLANSPDVVLKMSVSGDVLTLRIDNATTGSGTEQVPVIDGGSDVEFSLNYTYVLDAVDTIRSEELTAAWAGPVSPLFLTGDDPLPMTLVIMPMAK